MQSIINSNEDRDFCVFLLLGLREVDESVFAEIDLQLPFIHRLMVLCRNERTCLTECMNMKTFPSTPSGAMSTDTACGTWNLKSIFLDNLAWEHEFEAVRKDLSRIECFRGCLMDSAESLHAFLELFDELSSRADRLHSYASLKRSQDTRCQASQTLQTRADHLRAEVRTSGSFFEPEFLEAPTAERDAIIRDQRLQSFSFRFAEIERGRQFCLDCSEERLLGILSPLRTQAERIRTTFHDSEMVFRSFSSPSGKHEPGHGSIEALMSHQDRRVRKEAYESYTDSYLQHPQTHMNILFALAESSFLFAKTRGFRSTFQESLFHAQLTPEIFSAVIDSCKANRSLFHRYFRARAAIPGLECISEYDLLAPLSPHPPEYSFTEASVLVLDSLAPLGSDYVNIARRGIFEDGWVDAYPAPGKAGNPFSGGSYGTRPFILLNFSPSVLEAGTLAHELGHSMHSWLTNTTQPYCYSNYNMSVAETASNLNQVLFRAHLLRDADRDLTLTVLDEAFYFFHRYLFLMPALSEIEYLLHDTVARGGAMSADELSRACSRVFSEAYGGTVEFENNRLGIKWAQFCHFYVPFYFFQYAIGLSAAMTIGQRILKGDSASRKSYRKFLAAGASRPVPELFRIAGIDISDPGMYADAFSVLEEYVKMAEGMASIKRHEDM
jgi:oligoendopeptidase F